MDKITLSGEKRKIIGRKVKTLRKEGILPANIYGKKIKSEAIQIKLADFNSVFKKVGETGLVTLMIGKEEKPVLVANIQKNPVSGNPVHVDFHQVDLKEKVTAKVVVEMVGEAPAERQGVGTVVQYLDEIEVEALPMDLPEKFVVDVTPLAEVDQAIKISDLKIDQKKITVKADLGTILVKVEAPQKEEVVVLPPTEEVPAEGEAPVEGEVPAEGVVPAEGEVAPPKGPAVAETQAGKQAPAQEPKAEEKKNKN